MHEGGRFGLGYFQQHSHGIHLVVRGLNLCQLYQGHPEGPDVGLVVIRTVFGSFAHDHFRCHPAETGVSGMIMSVRISSVFECDQVCVSVRSTEKWIDNKILSAWNVHDARSLFSILCISRSYLSATKLLKEAFFPFHDSFCATTLKKTISCIRQSLLWYE